MSQRWLLEAQNIRKTFPGVVALDGVTIRLQAGEIHGLVGRNGAGKSTLVHILTGLLQPDSGRLCFDGVEYRMSPARARQLGIALVPQHPELVPSLSVAENIFCGHLPTTRRGFISWENLASDALTYLQRIGLSINPSLSVEELSVVERQFVAIAKALASQARLIILDEPTAVLSRQEAQSLFGLIRQLGTLGTTFLYISHYLEEIFLLCDNVTILRDGRVVGQAPTEQLTLDRVIELMTGESKEIPDHVTAVVPTERPVLQVQNLRHPRAYSDVSFSVRAGEILGAAGLESSGVHEFGRSLFGLEHWTGGTVYLNGRPYFPRDPYEALRSGLAYLPRDRREEGIVPNLSVAENITLTVLRRLTTKLGFLDRDRQRQEAARFVDALEIRAASLSQPVEYLSGGNQQKVVFAKLAITQPTVFVLDSPTHGIDIRAKFEVLALIARLAAAGCAVLLISDEVDELTEICHRIVVFYRGTITTIIDGSAARHNPGLVLKAIEGGYFDASLAPTL
jgi:ribose transport system ATP-binding protein